MKFIDHTFGNPAEDLACDEALLDACETDGGEALRFWEPHDAFVVLGYSNRLQTETRVEACRGLDIPVFRRASGGGTVLQAPGCLNYAVILKNERAPSVRAANGYVMERHRAALESLLGETVAVRGHTDLCLGELKFSGNSQRRKRSHFLFHGTLLLSMDLSLVAQALAAPSVAPEYRRGRGHEAFLLNLGIPPARVKAALAAVWKASRSEEPPHALTRELSARYADPAWTQRL